jgi:uroporphyrinogen decarboxylase
MTPKQRWRTLFRGGRPDRPPCDYWGTSEITTRLLADLQCASEREMWQALGIDKCVFLAPRHPRATESTWHIPSLYSIWNIKTTLIPYLDGQGTYEETVDPPLANAACIEEINDFPWPSPGDWDYSGLREECALWRDYPIVGASYEPFYLYCRLRGMTRALEDVALKPEFVDAVMERIYEIHAGIVERTLDAAGDAIDFIYVAEDLGTQQSLLMSPRMFRRSIKPWLAKMIALVHARGALVFHHDDGAIRTLIPDLIEIGIDVLNPVQWRCRGMDRQTLAAEYGDALVFHGGVDNQQTLPFATPEEVKREVWDNLRIFGPGKGYVVSPCHNIQINTPTVNIVAMYEAVHGGR